MTSIRFAQRAKDLFRSTLVVRRRVDRRSVVWLCLCLAALVSLGVSRIAGAQALSFEHVVIDANNPLNPHCKALGDIDGDGLIDAIVASSKAEGMFWYEYPSWNKHTVRATGTWTTDMQVGDVDGDGDLDIVIPEDGALRWYENPRPSGNPRTATWADHRIGTDGGRNHDVEVGDIDGDGDLDVVSRKKTVGGTFFWRQQTPTSWTKITISTGAGEGTALGDIDGDGDLDVAQNGYWIEQVSPTQWTERNFATNWPEDARVLVVDLNQDGKQDIVLTTSESANGRFSWFSASNPKSGPWTEHVVDPTASYLHSVRAADMDGDGDLDLVTAEMHQSTNPDEVSVYLNNGNALSWTQQVLATTGSHNLQVGDIGSDGDMDLFGANWNDNAPNSAVVEMWENLSSSGGATLSLDLWRRHIIETSLPWKAVFIKGVDLNADQLPDLVLGGWWYPNPGSLDGTWTRTTIGKPMNNMAVVHDFDADGDMDILGTNGNPSGENITWARNNGQGNFTNFDITNAPTGGDFIQGASVAQVVPGGKPEIVLSWHNFVPGTIMFTVPSNPTLANWPLDQISATTNGEQVPIGDINDSGRLDIHLGTQWLRQQADGSFNTRAGVTLGNGVPDRLSLADIDADGDLDVVIGAEGASRLVWGENHNNGDSWTEHVIATEVKYFSVDVGDIDGDGDIDVVGGAHKGNGEVYIYENTGQGDTWLRHVVDPGDSNQIDHHDGTQLVDMDRDGDLDIISVGWTKTSVVIYENLAIDGSGGGGGGDTTKPSIQSVVASNANQVVVGFSEALDPATAQNVTHYAISGGVNISDANLSTNGRTVTLVTTTLSEQVTYTLSVSQVQDLAGNVIAQNTQKTFEFVESNTQGGLVAHWPMNEGAGSTITDVTGNGHTGALVNGASWSTTGGDPAVSFDGVNDYVDVGSLNMSGNAMTLAAWFRVADLDNCPNRDCRIISDATGTAEQDHYVMISTIASGAQTRLRFRIKTNGTTTTLISGSGNVPENQWVHVAAVYDGAAMQLYMDGVKVGSKTKTGSITPSGAIACWIGGNPPDATVRPWDGQIDDVRIYNRALSAQEVQQLLESSNNQPPVATNKSVTTDQDKPVNITLQASDPDGDTLTYSVIDGPDHGTLSGSAANRTYTPNPGYSGSDAFQFQVNDGNGGSDIANVAITVNPATPANQPPVASDRTAVTDQDVAVNITLQASDPDGDLLTFSIISGPQHGTLSGSATNRTYTPNLGFTGSDTFDFKVSDGHGGSDTATVSITVTPVSADGLVAHWAFDETSGTTASDSSPFGANHAGTLRGDAAWASQGAIEGALSLDGFGDYVTVADSADINTTAHGQRTISAWFRVTNKAIASRKQVIYEEGGTGRGLNVYIHNGKLYAGLWDTAIGSSFLNTNQIQSDKWHHVALVLNGNATPQSSAFTAYLDGTSFGSGTGFQLGAHGDNIGIGGVAGQTKFHDGNTTTNLHGFAGLIDDIRVYNQNLTASEIQALEMSADRDQVIQVIDDGAEGFAATGDWEPFNGQGLNGDLHFSDAGNGSDVVTWTFNGLTPGRYRVSTTWSAHANRATNAPFTILDGTVQRGNIRVNQELIPQANVVVNGNNFQDLGTFDIVNSVLVVKLADNANEFVIADAVRIERVGHIQRVIDNADQGFSTTGIWTPFNGQGFDNDLHFSDAGNGSDVATWTFAGLAPGRYRVSATWSAHANRATNAPFTILDGTVQRGNIRVNQELIPQANVVVNGNNFQDLGTFDIVNSVLVVKLADNANEFVIADAIRIERVGNIQKVIDNADQGFTTTGIWTPSNGQGFDNDLHFSDAGNGSDVAAWTFTGLTPGRYRVSTTWSAHTNRATNAPFTVLDHSVKRGTIRVNQEVSPLADVIVNGNNFQDLGTFDVVNSVLVVKLADNANEFVIADAVRIERLGSPGD